MDLNQGLDSFKACVLLSLNYITGKIMIFYGIILRCFEVSKVLVKWILPWWKKSLWVLCCSGYYIKISSLCIPFQQDLLISYLPSVEVFPKTFSFYFAKQLARSKISISLFSCGWKASIRWLFFFFF